MVGRTALNRSILVRLQVPQQRWLFPRIKMEQKLEVDSELQPATNSTVVLLKPGASEYRGRLEVFLEGKGLQIVAEKKVDFTPEVLERFYPHAKTSIQRQCETEEEARETVQGLTDYLGSDKIIAIVVNGPNALNVVLSLKRKLRALLHLQKPRDYLHSSDSPEEAKREKEVLGLE